MDNERIDWQTRTLYKYRAINARTFSLLVNREVYFARSDKLNDPYDCQVSVIAAIDEAIAQTRDQISNNVAERLERLKKLSEVLANLEGETRKVGVLSLSKDNLNVLMWSHYADEHRGLCIGFRFSPEITQIHEMNRIIGTNPCHYCKSNPFADFFEEFVKAEELIPWKEFWQAILSIGMVSKSMWWQPENEVRVLRTEPGLVRFRPEELVEVIFGMRIGEQYKKTIRNILSADDWIHVKYSQITKSSKGFDLALEDA
ncbi:MAG: DUF2971 domain-containing protein [Desulfomonile sp.]|jgi:hypothetical protein